MTKKLILYFTAIILLTVPSFGQFDAFKKVKDKVKEVTDKTTSIDKATPSGGSKSISSDGGSAAVKIKNRASFDESIEMILTTKEFNSFTEAKPNAVVQVADGDPLWLYIKFKDPLEKYVYKPDDREEYILFFDIGGGKEGYNSYESDSLFFNKDQLSKNELKIALAPGVPGRAKSANMFLKVVGGGNPGVWENEIRISNSPYVPRGDDKYLARAPITASVAGGVAKYKKMKDEYLQMASRGFAEDNTLPAATKYVNNALKSQILSQLKNEGITPVKFYYSTDGWDEYTQNNVKVNRKIYAAYTYKKGAECLYGIAEVVQDYSHVTASYGATEIYLRYDSPILCEKLN